MNGPDRLKSAIKKLEQAPPAAWVQDMQTHYQKTGVYRASDIRRVVGDQTEGVVFGANSIQAALKSGH